MTEPDFPACDICGEPLCDGVLVRMELPSGLLIDVCDACADRCPGRVAAEQPAREEVLS
jgi:hypothetical protein